MNKTKSYQKVKNIISDFGGEWLSIDGVFGIGWGLKDNSYYIQVLISKEKEGKIKKIIPAEIDGIKIIFIYSKSILALNRIVYNKKQINVKKQSLGKMAVFLIPSLKLKQRFSNKTVEELIHQFLINNFNGYTVEAGNIFGYWKDENNKEEYGEHRRFTVAFKSKDKIPVLEKFLAKIGKLINERCVYLEIGEDAWLIFS